jgi:two-component system probable response regulator PhcQ
MSVRILTTAYADIDAAIEGVNLGSIYKYVVKPWELEELRAMLRQAMDYRLLRQERHLLLSEKLATLQYLLVADRMRGLKLLARGLSHHIRNALTPLESHVFFAKTELDPESEGDLCRLREISTDAESVNRHLLELVESVSAATIDLHCEFGDRVTIESLLARGQQQAAGSGEAIALRKLAPIPAVTLRCDAAAMTRMFAALLRQMARLDLAHGRVAGNAELCAEYLGTTRIWGSPAEWLRLRAAGAWNRDAVAGSFTPFAMTAHGAEHTNSDLLTAFFIVQHHRGTLELHAQAPEGPGFELKLPHDPLGVERPALESNLFERLLLHAEDWYRLERNP